MKAPRSDRADYRTVREEFMALLALDAVQRQARIDRLGRSDSRLAEDLLWMLRVAESEAMPSQAEGVGGEHGSDPMAEPLVPLAEVLEDAVGEGGHANAARPGLDHGRPSDDCGSHDRTRVRPGAEGSAPDPTHPLPSLGLRYRALSWLGIGTVGDVYLAEQLATGGLRVAVKVFLERGGGGAAQQRFLREARILGRLEHPGIARILDAGTLPDGRTFLAMEFIDGRPIDRAAAALQLGLAERLDLIIQLCEAVDHAHRRGVIHRDLKPGNVLVTRGSPQVPGAARVKVIDFGIAKLLDLEQSPEPTITERGQLLGTLSAMSPEQLAGEPAETRSDVYAIGLLLHRLLTGEAPTLASRLRPADETVIVNLQDAAIGDPLGDSGRRRPLPSRRRRDLEAILRRALALAPDDRYPSPADLAEDLRRFVANRAIQARTHSLLDHLRLAVRRSPRTAAIAAAVSLLAVAGLAALVRTAAALAEERRTQRDQLTQILDDVLDAMYPLMEARAPRHALSRLLLARTDNLLALDPGDPGLLEARARLLQELGNVEFESGLPSEALATRAQALEQFALLSERQPESVPLRRRHAEALVRHADVLYHVGQVEQARTEYTTAFELLRQAAAMAPSDIGVLDDLTWAFDRLWDDQDARLEPDRIMALLAEREAVVARLLKLDPQRTLSHFTLMEGHRRRAVVLAETGQVVDALHALDLAVAIGDELVRREPRRLHYALNTGHTLIEATRLARIAQDHPRLKRMARRADQVSRMLLECEPGRVEVLLLRLSERQQAAHLAREDDDLKEAEAASREVEELRQKLQGRDGDVSAASPSPASLIQLPHVE